MSESIRHIEEDRESLKRERAVIEDKLAQLYHLQRDEQQLRQRWEEINFLLDGE